MDPAPEMAVENTSHPHFLHQYYPEATRHVDATWNIGSGNSIANAIVFGRIAVREAARALLTLIRQ